MKHFLTLAALLTSLSPFAQLPYNPDANNDGLIGAFDLQSLLSVYSNPFSNGVLGEGVVIAEPCSSWTVGNVVYHSYNCLDLEQASSFVFDLTVFSSSFNHQLLISGDWVNGMTFSFFVPPTAAGSSLSNNSYSGHISQSGDCCNDFYLTNPNPFIGKLTKFVWWNGTVHVLGY